MKADRQFEQQCAEKLVMLLVARHRNELGPIQPFMVTVAANWKVKFRFKVPQPNVCDWLRQAAPRSLVTRVGRRPGLELDWKWQAGDVDALQFAGDVASALAHSWQIFRKWITGREERPSKLLRIVERENVEMLKGAKVEAT